METLTQFPESFYAGDTVKIRRTINNAPSSDWLLSYSLANADGVITFDADASDGDTHLVVLPAIDTLAFVPGVYAYVGQVISLTSSPTETYTVESGNVEILDRLSAATDIRTHVKRTLDLIEAEIERRVTGSVESYSIASRSLTRAPMSDLIAARDRYAQLHATEERKARRKSGKVKVRFL